MPGSTPGSKRRNLFSYAIFATSLVILLDVGLSTVGLRFLDNPLAIVSLMVLSFVYFYETTLGVIRLVSKQFQINPLRLGRDIAISILFTVLSFALYYDWAGLVDTLDGCLVKGLSNHIYFSLVTFSTLGFGDFRPEPGARLVAAMQALYGNLHLGMIVGALYLAIEVYGKRDKR